MKLSGSEKLILMMLSEIYEHLKIKGEIDPTFVKSAILSGNTWGLNWEYSGIFQDRDEDDPLAVHDVVSTLEMWYILESSYSKLSPEDKERVKVEADPFGDDVHFRGFDGNNEGEHMSVAYFLINNLGRFREFKGRDLNSHAPSLETYNRMLTAYNPMRSSLSGPLSAPQIIQILNEQTHPSRRK